MSERIPSGSQRGSALLFGEMCNAYEIGGKQGSFPGFARAESLRKWEEFVERRLIRRTDCAPILLATGELTEMSWGFRREKLGVINNSRSDKLAGPMWQSAYRERRCLIPVAGYFEWMGEKGRKQTYRFEASEGGWLWMAGIWEDSAEFGKCFSMITTEASAQVEAIHHRMPVALRPEQQEVYLKGGEVAFGKEFAGVRHAECANPLLRKRDGPVQEELF